MYAVGNDTPAWKRPRLTVYFVYMRRGTITDIVRKFKTREAAEALYARLNGAA